MFLFKCVFNMFNISIFEILCDLHYIVLLSKLHVLIIYYYVWNIMLLISHGFTVYVI